MPIFEFYCQSCHTIYSFFASPSRVGNPASCPQCGNCELERKPSRFATPKARDQDEDQDQAFAAVDETKLEQAFETLAVEAERMGEDEDPRAMGRLMRSFSRMTGIELGERMEDMVHRLEAGEDPDALESEMMSEEPGDDSAEAFFRVKRALRRRAAPRVDEELYFL